MWAHEVSSSGLGSVNHCPSGHYRAHDRNQRSFLLLCASSTFPALEAAKRTPGGLPRFEIRKSASLDSVTQRVSRSWFAGDPLMFFLGEVVLVLDDVVHEAS